MLDRNGIEAAKLSEFLINLRNDDRRLPFATLILPASIGGIIRGTGLLDPTRIGLASGENGEPVSTDVADERAGGESRRTGEQPGGLVPARVADERRRHRLLKTAGAETKPLFGTAQADPRGFATFMLDLPPDCDTTRQLVSRIPKRERIEFGVARLALSAHVALVQKHACRIAEALDLKAPIRQALELAAAWHDQGKNRDDWQRSR